ncbi:MAG: Ig-like domain-containing protein [Nitrospiraceae bacterium]|nr:Ig-like domain-containing protein [Nitrospiraceae bacterium]
MKINKDKKLLGAILGFSAIVVILVLVHGCGISSYEGKKLTSVSIDPVKNTAVAGTVTIAAQTVQQFKATGHYSDSTTTDLSQSVTWNTSNASVATVSATGLATAVASSGTCTITATGQGMAGTTQLAIKSLPLQTITVTPGAASTNIGMTVQFNASGLFSDGTETIASQDITTLVSWSSTTTSVATVDLHSGVATGVAAGTTSISAHMGLVTSTTPATLTVSNLALDSIAVTGGAIHVGSVTQMTATATFVGGSTADITSQAAWSSSNPAIATVDNTGKVTGVTTGLVTISASAGGKTGSFDTLVMAPAGH